MSLKLTLSQRTILLLLVPLISEIAMIGSLLYLQNLSEREAAQATQARVVAEAIGRLIKVVYDTYGAVIDNTSGTEFVVVPSRQKLSDIGEEFRTLRGLVATDGQSLSHLDRASESNKQAVEQIEAVRQEYESGHLQEAHFSLRILKLLRKSITQELVTVSDIHRAVSEKGPVRMAEIRGQIRWALLVGGIATLILTVQVSLVFARTVTNRIVRISDNVSRLARGASLLPPLVGTDEIARLDQAFHEMVSALEDAIGKERAITENAVDMICSIDAGGAFLAVNPACERLLACEVDDLIGARLLSLVPPEEHDSVNQSLERCRGQEDVAQFETRLVRRDGKIVDTLWSTRSSPENQNLFCVVHDVSDRKEAERIKQEVIAMVSHDLRSPLSTVKVVHESLLQGVLGGLNERGERMVTVAAGNVERMMSLINDLLLIEKAKSGGMRLRKTTLDLKAVMEAARESVMGWAGEKDISVQISDAELLLEADEGRIIQVLTNLLGNAVKFSPKHSRVVLYSEVREGQVLIHVEDQGEPIPLEMRRSIFERFQQVTGKDSENMSGSGLGLAICKTIVEAHDGQIWVECGSHAGNRFSFSLPYSMYA
ncbi:MAG TPA: ATP-binding protein [Candidatus Obscuribacter sp.]|nr:PAS domain S-box protein [Candidatus Obscuribacter sp.]MBK9279041.1 PAS domain S-box protein [Candidatus Obscuribacter sp.]HMX46472.1 ATP-binding protein [Candidatus Obscuribacter sp.]HMY56036.1 ATP-binding protein [Candidatus Obscuribacter sp.]HND04112.1 ATP-binding protein [Candidatus Obscuribacter sp.]